MPMPDTIAGGCLCGRVRYRSLERPLLVVTCHCHHCQRHGGSAFALLVGLLRGGLALEGDTLADFEDRGASGGAVRRRFCSGCGSSVAHAADATPDFDWVHGGTLDDRAWLEPRVRLWAGHAQPWLADDEPPAFAGNPSPR